MTANYPPSLVPDPLGGNAVYDELKRHEIQVLYRAGFSVRQVAKKTEIARNTVRRILRQAGLEPEPGHRLGRPPLATPFQATAQKLLEERPDLPTVEVLRLLREHGYAGGKDPVYRLVQELRKSNTHYFGGICSVLTGLSLPPNASLQ
jgi:transposase